MRFLDKKRLFLIVGCALAAASLVYLGSLAASRWLSSPPPPPIPQSISRVQKPTAAKPGKDAPASMPSSHEHPVNPSTPTNAPGEAMPKVEPPVPVAGNLGVITALRAQLEEVRIQAAIAQEREKVQSKATPAQPQAIVLHEPPKTVPAPKPREASPVVLSIQGVDGHSSATVRLGSGQLMSLRTGDRFDGGVVSAIDRKGISIRRGHTSTILSFEEASWN